MESEQFRLWDDHGRRLYLTPDERERFRSAAAQQPERELRTFAHLLLNSGCRISEGLAVIPDSISFSEKAVLFRTLKKRTEKRHHRAVPLPPAFLDELDLLHRIKGRKGREAQAPLWTWHRGTAWYKIKAVMKLADIDGPQATAKGLRHGFGVIHAINRTPIPILQRWMGHSDPKTTAIYLQVVGEEAHQLAAAAW